MEMEYKHQEKKKWKMNNKQDIIQFYIWIDIIPRGKNVFTYFQVYLFFSDK